MGGSCDHCSRKRRRAKSEASDDEGAALPTASPEGAAPRGAPTLASPRADPQTTGDSAEAGRPHPRLVGLPSVRAVMDGVVPPELCRELIFALRSASTVGYRPHVRSATIHDVVATAPWLLPPLVRARNAVLSAVEAAFGLSLELAVEFSGLIAWSGGAALGWHHDANREYLTRRHLSAVLYLNTQGEDFGAGDFRFQDGPEPLRVAPRAGRLVAYTADRRNVHCVEAVGWGERCTLTLWFSLDPAAAEDDKVLQQLRLSPALQPRPPYGCTTPAAPATAPPAAAVPSVSHSVSAPAPESALAESPVASDRRRPEDGVSTGRPGGGAATHGSVPGQSWWGRCLGPGLPSTMYQLPPADAPGAEGRGPDAAGRAGPAGGGGTAVPAAGAGEGRGGDGCGGGDLRIARLRQLGLYVARGVEDDSVDGRSGASRGGRSVGVTAVDGGQLWEAPGAVNARPREAEGGEEGGEEGREEVWVGVADEVEVATATAAAAAREMGIALEAAAGSTAGGSCWAGAAAVGRPAAAPPLLCFPSLSAALLAAQFASYSTGILRFRSAVVLEAALRELPEYVAQRMDEIRKAFPIWVTLGSLLSGN